MFTLYMVPVVAAVSRTCDDQRVHEDDLHRLLSVSVECYAGYRGDETPVRFKLGDRFVEVREVLDRWLAPDHRYFKVRTAEGLYILRNDTVSGAWELTLFERGTA